MTLNNTASGDPASPEPSEATLLLDNDNTLSAEVAPTPLPLEQLSILFFLRFCESAATFCIFPFLEELLRSVIKGGEEQVGYYTGLMDMIRHSIALVTVMYWSRLSDKIGRKPILLLGTTSLVVSMISFGMYKSFWALVISRCIFTALNSNAGIIKSVIGEITDSSNSANAFALLHVPWAAGFSFGAFVGGHLSGLHQPFGFTQVYPYLLPCATMGALSFVAFLISAIRLRETLLGSRTISTDSTCYSNAALHTPNDGERLSRPYPLPYQELITTRSVLIPLLNYSALAFLHTCSNTILPLYLALPARLGGLGLPPSAIGTILSGYGAVNAVFQVVFLGRLVKRFGVKGVFVAAISASVPMYAMYVVNNIVANLAPSHGSENSMTMVSGRGSSSTTYVLIAIQLAFSLIIECGYSASALILMLVHLHDDSSWMSPIIGLGCIYIFITSASPNPHSLGSTNGLAQTMVSVVRLVAAPFAGSLLSFSIQSQWIWGYGVHATMCLLGLASLLVTRKLPDSLSY